MSATITTQRVATIGEASRYLAELTATVGFDEGLRRLQSRAAPDVERELDKLKRYVGGSGERPPPELALHGEYLQRVPDATRAAAGAATINAALRDARMLADGVRVGMPGDLLYSAVLLLVAGAISVLWLLEIGPAFAELFATIGARTLPLLSEMLLRAPWIVLVAIAVLASALVALAIGAFRIAAALETMMAPTTRWARWAAGDRVLHAQERWRATTLAAAWAQAGREPLAALRDAVGTVSADSRALAELNRRVELASGLGVGRHELEHQLERSVRDCRAALELRRAVAVRTIQIAIAVLVGAITVAIYLPIFELGAVI